MVAMLAATGASVEQIAGILDATPAEIREHFADDLENGPARLRAQLLASLERAARAGDKEACAYLAERYTAGKC